MNSSRISAMVWVSVFSLALASFAATAYATTGAIFTTNSACTGTNINLYGDKGRVYLDGGPRHFGSAGLPDGDYYVRVTEPNGTLLGTSVGSGNDTPVSVVDGSFVGCPQLSAILIKASNGLGGYDSTSNGGGEYKVWVSETSDFLHSEGKTDNFKVVSGSDDQCVGDEDECAQPKGTLVVKKVVINDDATGSATAGSFSFSVNGGISTLFIEVDPTHGENTIVVSPGTYNVTETADDNYWTAYDNCSNVSIAAGETETCTITNDDIPLGCGDGSCAPPPPFGAQIFGYKFNDVDGDGIWDEGELGKEGVTITLNGSEQTAVTDEDGLYFFDVAAGGTYIIREVATTGWVQTTPNPEDVSVSPGDVAGPYNFGNQQQATLTVKKNVVNDNGGDATAADFTLHVKSGEADVDGSPAAGSETGTVYTLAPGTYTVSENAPISGYDQTGIDCGEGSENGTVTLAGGDDVTCTITNDDQPAHVVLTKVVTTNNGGTAGVNDFGLTVGGESVNSGQTLDVDSNTAIALNETGLAGYQFVSLTGDPKCPAVRGGTVTLDEGETVHCTITNDDIAPKLTLVKKVKIDDWGTAVPENFNLMATGGPTPFSGYGNVTSDGEFDAGTYTLSESGPGGYAASGWTCTGEVTNTGNSITLGLGQTASCEITNDDLAGRMTGGGSIFTISGETPVAGNRITHGFELACKNPDLYAKKNNLEINWNIKGNKSDKFHLDKLTSVTCINDPALQPGMPAPNGFDTMIGTGTGSYNGTPGYNISFTMTDAGEPGSKDQAMYTVWKGPSTTPINPVLKVSGLKFISQGNQQAHRF